MINSSDDLVADLTSRASSRLYPMAAQGAGTTQVERQTSFLRRLAHAYRVSPRNLLRHEVLPRFGRLWSSPYYSTPPLRVRGRAIDDTDPLAAAVEQALSSLTGRRDLDALSLARWRGGFSSEGLLRNTRAWCTQCYQDWSAKNQPLYETLVWGFTAVTRCSVHGRPLQTHCPNVKCQRVQNYLDGQCPPGCCQWCGASLAYETNRQDRVLSNQDTVWERWVGDTVAELVALPGGVLAEHHHSAARRRALIKSEFGGSERAFANAVGIREPMAHAWVSEGFLPSFALLLRVCAAVGTTPARLLLDTCGDANAEDSDFGRLKRGLELPRQPLVPVACIRRCRRVEIRWALSMALWDEPDPPMSLSAIATLIRCPAQMLRDNCKDLAHEIDDRHASYWFELWVERTRRRQRELRYEERVQLRSGEAIGV